MQAAKKYVLPAMDHKFEIQVTGEETGMNWTGKFLYRRPNLQERTMIDVMRVRLNGDLYTIDPDVKSFNEAISHLKFTLKESPQWWVDQDYGSQMYDANVVLAVYEKCLAFEATWRATIHGGDAAAVEAGHEIQPS